MLAFSQSVAGKPVNLLDPQELAANRRGEITQAQKQRFNTTLGQRQVFVMALAMLVIVSVSFMAFFLIISTASFRSNILPPLLISGGLFLIFLLFRGRNLWNLWDKITKFKHDEANCAIRQGQGQLSYSKKGYVFQTIDRSLALPANNTNGLLPGATYRVYYLEESGFLLSAEESYKPSPAQVRIAINEILAMSNGFSFEDLTANQNGEVAPAQRRKALPNILLGAVIGVVALLCIMAIFLGIISPGHRNTPLLIMGVLGGILLLWSGFVLVTALIDMFISAPQQTQGVAHKEIRVRNNGRSKTTRYYYTVIGQSFEVSQSAYTALIEGLKYRIYYLPRTKRLIAIETLE